MGDPVHHQGSVLKHPFERIAGRMAGREVKVAGDFQLYFNPINLKFYAEGLTVANADWANPARRTSSRRSGSISGLR